MDNNDTQRLLQKDENRDGWLDFIRKTLEDSAIHLDRFEEIQLHPETIDVLNLPDYYCGVKISPNQFVDKDKCIKINSRIDFYNPK